MEGFWVLHCWLCVTHTHRTSYQRAFLVWLPCCLLSACALTSTVNRFHVCFLRVWRKNRVGLPLLLGDGFAFVCVFHIAFCAERIDVSAPLCSTRVGPQHARACGPGCCSGAWRLCVFGVFVVASKTVCCCYDCFSWCVLNQITFDCFSTRL